MSGRKKKRRGHAWKVRPKRAVRVSVLPEASGSDILDQWDCATLRGEDDAGHGTVCRLGIFKSLKQVAQQLWESDYAPIAAAELAQLTDMGMLDKALELKSAAPRSSYAARKAKQSEVDENKVAKQLVKECSHAGFAAALSIRQANQQTYPFTICARSVAFMAQRVPVKTCASAAQTLFEILDCA